MSFCLRFPGQAQCAPFFCYIQKPEVIVTRFGVCEINTQGGRFQEYISLLREAFYQQEWESSLNT